MSSRSYRVSAEDRRFQQAFEACTFPPADFDHRAHLRLAYIYLADREVDEALAAMKGSILRFLDHNGVDPSKYHETLTLAWLLAVRHFMVRCGEAASADDFIGRSPALLDRQVMLTHYSSDTLFSATARARFLEPDLAPIPRY